MKDKKRQKQKHKQMGSLFTPYLHHNANTNPPLVPPPTRTGFTTASILSMCSSTSHVLLARMLSAQDAMISRTLLEATWEQARKRMARREWKTKKEKDSCWNRVEQ